jgi:hypothetical protein
MDSRVSAETLAAAQTTLVAAERALDERLYADVLEILAAHLALAGTWLPAQRKMAAEILIEAKRMALVQADGKDVYAYVDVRKLDGAWRSDSSGNDGKLNRA